MDLHPFCQARNHDGVWLVHPTLWERRNFYWRCRERLQDRGSDKEMRQFARITMREAARECSIAYQQLRRQVARQ